MARFNFLNVGCADCTIINTGNSVHIIDCNAEIKNKVSYLPQNKRIRAVFITHHHYDHYEGLGYLYDSGYSIEYLFISPYERRNSDNSVALDEYNGCMDLVNKFEKKGTKIYKPFRQESFDNPYWEIDGLKYWMIGPIKQIAEEPTRELHDASLVMSVASNGKTFCFTGDASDKSLNMIAGITNNFSDELLHASHHGSINGADLDFIKKANPKYTLISTKSGVHESVPHDTALKRYRMHTREKVLRTDVDGELYHEV